MPGDQPTSGSTPPPPLPKLSASDVKAERIELVRQQLARGYSPAQVITWLVSIGEGKAWKVGRSTARNYVDRALEALNGEVVQTRDRKQARVRAMFTMAFQRAMELAGKADLEHKAAGLLTAAISAADKIARVDGSYEYDASTLAPATAAPATADEAARLINHASATLELAIRRGAITVKPAAPPVIDATEAEDASDGEPEPDDEIPGNAN